MRELKFRAWDKSRSTMLYAGNGLGLDFNGSLLQWVEQSRGKYAYSHSERNLELMQYTGLKDKNGVEIYEGDIVRLSDGQDYLVDWGEGAAYFHLIGRDDEIPNGGDRLLVAHLGDIQVIATKTRSY